MTKIAIIGAGIVGASAAYFLKEKGYQEVVLFDKEEGQASKAAAGIICPWFSKRRHKAWYKMARLGADFYQELVEKLAKDGYETSFYQQTGVYLLKNKEKQLEALYDLANERRAISPLIGDLRLLSKEEVASAFPGLQGFDNCLWASGAAHVDGKRLCQTLISASGYPIYRKSVNLLPLEKGYQIDGDYFDVVILAAGAWLPQLLSPLGYEVDVRPQKGQLIDYQMEALQTDDYAVVMPEGELDIIPFDKGKISVGASHENDKGYDVTLDYAILNHLEKEALHYFPSLKEAKEKRYRVGIRAYTSDYSPFYGMVPGLENLYAASGLGSSGLTTGPLIAHEMVALLTGGDQRLDANDYPITTYLIPADGKK